MIVLLLAVRPAWAQAESEAGTIIEFESPPRERLVMRLRASLNEPSGASYGAAIGLSYATRGGGGELLIFGAMPSAPVLDAAENEYRPKLGYGLVMRAIRAGSGMALAFSYEEQHRKWVDKLRQADDEAQNVFIDDAVRVRYASAGIEYAFDDRLDGFLFGLYYNHVLDRRYPQDVASNPVEITKLFPSNLQLRASWGYSF